MKILFITDNFPPEVNAPATRTYEHCKEWVNQGEDVTIITGFPNFPQGKIYKGYKNKLYQKETIDGIKVIRVWTYITANEGFLKRTIDYISFAIMAFFAGLFIKTDIIIATSPQFFTTVSGYMLSVFKRKPWAFEVRDLWPESIRAVSVMNENSVIYKMLERIEMYLYKKADLIITVTDSFKKNITSRGIKENKITVIKNGANLNLYSKRQKNENIIKKYGLQNKFLIGYIGTHGMAHKLDFILHCANRIDDLTIHFLFIGDGAEKLNLKKLAEKLNLNNVTFLDSIPKYSIPDYLSILDVALVPLKKSETFKTVIPSKIFEAAAMEIPILLGVEGEAKKIIELYSAGVCYEPENEESFLKNLNAIKINRILYNNLQEGCNKLAADFDRKELAAGMLKELKTAVQKK